MGVIINNETKSLTGLKIGNWAIGEEIRKNGKIYYKCVCLCGKCKDVYRHSLIKGESKSCGCLSVKSTIERTSKDRTGIKCGSLTLAKRIPNYKNNKTYYLCKCDCGNEKIVSNSSLTSNKSISCGCVRPTKKRNSYVGERFSRLLVVEMLYNYKNGSTYAECQCDCGTTKNIDMRSLKSGATKSCGCLEKESRYSRSHVVDVSGKRFGLLTVINKFQINKQGHMVWLCKCDCGNTIKVTTGDLNRKHVKSCGCNRYEINSLDLTNQTFGNLTALYPISSKNRKRRKWKCICVCGNESVVGTSDLTSYRTSSCGCVKHSKYETFISDMLTKFEINFIPQYKFEDCKNIRPLPFDFYLPDSNIAIEYQGEQHYKSIDYFGGEDAFIKRQRNDRIKKEYCLNNKIDLMCLPYTLSREEIKYIIQSIENPVTTTA